MSDFDVIEVEVKTGSVRLLAEKKTKRNAEAIVDMAVARRGCENHFYTVAMAGKYRDGDPYLRD